jgi:hypothetical protein
MLRCVLDLYVDIAVACVMIHRHVVGAEYNVLLPLYTCTHKKKIALVIRGLSS